MRVQRVILEELDARAWIVLEDDYKPVQPILAFIKYLLNLNRSPNTIRAYAHSLKTFWEFLRYEGVDWTAVGLYELALFLGYLRRGPRPKNVLPLTEPPPRRKPATLNTILAAVSAFYDFQQCLGRVKEIPLYRYAAVPHTNFVAFLDGIAKPRPRKESRIAVTVPRLIPKVLTEDQVRQLLSAARRLRDKFLILLLFDTGMRIGQALGLRHSDIMSYDLAVCIRPRDDNANGARSKSIEPYTIHVSEEAMRLYTDYVIYECDEVETDYVFVNLWGGTVGRPMSYYAVADLFHRLAEKTSIPVHPHMLRHTHATEMLRSGTDIKVVQERLGHRQIQTTIKFYTHLSNADLKKAYREFLLSKRKR
jgi:integrase/recombinase XerD